MKRARILSGVFALLGLVLILGTWVLSVYARSMPIRLLGSADEACARTEALMEAISRQDHAAAGSMLYGEPELLSGDGPSSQLTAALWDAFTGSVTYEFTSQCYTSGQGVYRDVTISALDIPALMPALEVRYKELLNQRELAETDHDRIWDENGDYREEFLMEVLSDAAEEVLSGNVSFARWDITMELVCRDGQWWVVPDQALLQVLSGGMAEQEG